MEVCSKKKKEPTIIMSFPNLAAFMVTTIKVNDVQVKLEIWDTAGQEKYHSLAPMYYRGAHGAIVVYDITDMVNHMLLISIYITCCFFC